jgi:hypothetical protein
MALDKLDVDVGSLAANDQAVETFLVGNAGRQELRVRVADLRVLEGCDAVEAATEAAAVAAGQLVVLPIVFGPHRDVGPHRYSMTLESNDPARARQTLSVRFTVVDRSPGQVAGPNLLVDKSLVNTGDVPYDWPMYERFTLRNTGDKPLVLEARPTVRVETGC